MQIEVDLEDLHSYIMDKSRHCHEGNIEERELRIEESPDMMDDNTHSEVVEARLSMMLRREDFDTMEVVGQFNNAFIFTRLGDEMFMIDQHASDEKYNFERLQKMARVKTQLLVQPRPLRLGAVHKPLLRDNLAVFRANGFDFSVNENETEENEIALTSVPDIHDTQFDKEDVDEILAHLTEFPGMMYRPQKLRNVFASKACRMSVMAGTAISEQQMEQIVRNMGTMDQPWNCPHGRPTIRHLCHIESPNIDPKEEESIEDQF